MAQAAVNGSIRPFAATRFVVPASSETSCTWASWSGFVFGTPKTLILAVAYRG